jgi:hypothetical protein
MYGFFGISAQSANFCSQKFDYFQHILDNCYTKFGPNVTENKSGKSFSLIAFLKKIVWIKIHTFGP